MVFTIPVVSGRIQKFHSAFMLLLLIIMLLFLAFRFEMLCWMGGQIIADCIRCDYYWNTLTGKFLLYISTRVHTRILSSKYGKRFFYSLQLNSKLFLLFIRDFYYMHLCEIFANAEMVKQMLRWFPRFQVATTCFSCSPPDLNSVVSNFMFCIHVK